MSDYQPPDPDNRSRRATPGPGSYQQDPTRKQSPPPRQVNRSRPADDVPDWYEDESGRHRPVSRGRHSEDQRLHRSGSHADRSRSRAVGADRLTSRPRSSGHDASSSRAGAGWEAPDPQRDWSNGPRGWDDVGWGLDEDYSAGNSSRAQPYRQHRGDARPGGTAGWWDTTRHWASLQGTRVLGIVTRATQDGVTTRPGGLGTRRQRIIAVAILACMLLCTLGSSLTLFVQYQQISAFAHSGLQHVKNAEVYLKTLQTNPFDSQSIQAAHAQFSAAHSDFSEIYGRLNLVGIASGAPVVGPRVSGAQKLVPIAVEATQAGMLACDLLNTLVTSLKNPFGSSGGGLSTTQYAIIAAKWSQLHPLATTIIGQLGQLTPSDLTLDPRLGPLVEQFRSNLPQISQLVSEFDGVIAALPQLLGVEKPSTYLMLLLDSSELRPTGGFIGNFGALAVDKGQLEPSFHISDITLIDSSVKFGSVPYQQVIPVPARYAWLKTIFVAGGTDSWSLRDSNLDPDYPTTAKYALQLYQHLLPDAQKNLQAQNSSVTLYDPQKSGAFAGVVTLSYGFFQQALKITGPITVNAPPIHEIVTADNFVSKIHYYALSSGSGPDNEVCGTTSCSKVFTSAVVQAFMDTVKTNLPVYIGKLGKLFFDSLHTKDIEIFVNDPKTEQTLIDLGVGASVQAPTTGDSVFEVEANIGGNKDNSFLQYQMSDRITVDQSGAATHHLSWNYTWPNDPATLAEAFPAGAYDYHSYSRVYVPPGAALISKSNLASFGQSSASAGTFNRKVFHGAAYAYFGETSNYAVSWKTPGVVTHDSAGYHYRLLFQREAGIAWPLTLTITLPACAKVTGAPQVSGLTSLNLVTVKGTTVTVTGPLTQDQQIQVNYAC